MEKMRKQRELRVRCICGGRDRSRDHKIRKKGGGRRKEKKRRMKKIVFFFSQIVLAV